MNKNQVKRTKHKSGRVKSTELPATGDKKNLWQIIIILFITSLAFYPVLHGEFLNWDDNQYVYDNTLIRSFSNLPALITTPLQGNYHPLTMITLALNYAISSYEPWSYHLVNLLLHLLNTVLVYILALKLSKNNLIIAFVTSILFGIHPMHVESVAWVAERKDVLYSFFFLLGLVSYVNFTGTKSKKQYWLSVLWLLLSLASKPAAVVFPLAMLAVDLLQKRKLSIVLITEKTPHFILSLVLGMLTLYAQTTAGATETIAEFSLANRFLFACYSFMMYIVKFIVPASQSPFYPYPSTTGALPVAHYLAPFFVLAVILVCAMTFKKNNIVCFAFVFYLVNIILIMQFFIVGRAIIAERYTYIPYVGLSYFAGWLIFKASEKYQFSYYYIIIPVVLIFATLTRVQASHWKNSASFWDYGIKAHPGSRVYHNRGVLYRREGNFEKALELYNEALKYHDDVIDDAIFANRANVYFDKKEYAKAVADYNRAIMLNNNDFLSYENRGSAYLMMNKFDSALIDFNRSLQLKPDNPDVFRKKGILFFNRNMKEEAIAEYLQYIKYKPSDSETLNTIAACYQALGRFDEAVKYYTKAIKTGNNPVFYLNRSYAYYAMGKKAEARDDALTARQAGVNVPESYLGQLTRPVSL